jgi:hypothetical protein
MPADVRSPNGKMADDGVDALAWHSEPASVLRQPGLYPGDRSPTEPGHFRKLAPRVQRYDLWKKQDAIGSAPDDERRIWRIRYQLDDPGRQIGAGSDGNVLCFRHIE